MIRLIPALELIHIIAMDAHRVIITCVERARLASISLAVVEAQTFTKVGIALQTAVDVARTVLTLLTESRPAEITERAVTTIVEVGMNDVDERDAEYELLG